ncbi:hypothetical protein Taro_000915 [Colocasia esculenta]|uniref:Uncharacterized protein n=1 Tax=Colocasia esculenta TaxID=4460 RepID=A0A843TC75_COLES|nr:hypothetical protein [Colocasia esculenta]
MKGECPENKKEKHKKFQKFKKPKAMLATWSDEDSSEEEEERKSSSSESVEVCFMANSSDGKVSTSFEDYTIDDWQDAYAGLVEKFSEMRKENKHIKNKIENFYHNQSSNHRICELETKITELHEEKENLLNLIDELKLASQKASQEFKDITEKLEIEKQEKQQKIEEIETLKNQLKERDEVIQTFTKGKDNLEALLGTTMTTTSHGLGFNKKKPMKDKSGEKKGKAPLIKFVKGPNLENTEIQQIANKTLNKTQNKAKTQKQKKTIRSTQSPDRSTCSTSKATNNSTKNSNKNLKNKKMSKEIIHEKPWTSKTTFQDDWTNPWSQWYENPCWYHPQFLYPNFLMSTPFYLVSTHFLGQVDTTFFLCRHCPLARTF